MRGSKRFKSQARFLLIEQIGLSDPKLVILGTVVHSMLKTEQIVPSRSSTKLLYGKNWVQQSNSYGVGVNFRMSNIAISKWKT